MCRGTLAVIFRGDTLWRIPTVQRAVKKTRTLTNHVTERNHPSRLRRPGRHRTVLPVPGPRLALCNVRHERLRPSPVLVYMRGQVRAGLLWPVRAVRLPARGRHRWRLVRVAAQLHRYGHCIACMESLRRSRGLQSRLCGAVVMSQDSLVVTGGCSWSWSSHREGLSVKI